MGSPGNEALGIDPQELTVRKGEYPESESPLETAWTFWYDKKTSDKKESDQYIEGLTQLGTFNTIEGFYRHYTYLLRPSEFPRDHNVFLFRKGFKPMWEEFPEGGCWIIRIKRKGVSQNYVNRMWENLLLACIGEAFDMPDVVGCVLSTRLKDDVLSIWNLSNKRLQARFRIGEMLKEVLDLDMNALIQYKDHYQSLQDYSTYRNARNFMFLPSPSATPQQANLATPVIGSQRHGPQSELPGDAELDDGLLPPAMIDLGPAAVDSDGFDEDAGTSLFKKGVGAGKSPAMNASAAPFSPAPGAGGKSPALDARAAPFSPSLLLQKSPALNPGALAFTPPTRLLASDLGCDETDKPAGAAAEKEKTASDKGGKAAAVGEGGGKKAAAAPSTGPRGGPSGAMSYAAMAAKAKLKDDKAQ